MLHTEQYPHLEWFSQQTRIPPANLVKGFEIEKQFHKKILEENDPAVRKGLYLDLYTALVPLYEALHKPESGSKSKMAVVDMFQNELVGRSIVDVGCGAGNFLMCVCDCLKTKTLMGLDVVIPYRQEFQTEKYRYIRFKQVNIVDFSLDDKFDVVFSDNVMEHLAPKDLSTHLKSINRALVKDGTFIALLPNRLFGPSDATRIIDNTHTNKLPALGSHLGESTYTDFLPVLSKHGFGDFKTTIQTPILYRTLSRLLNRVRITPSLYVFIENSPKLLEVLYKSTRKNSYIFMLLMIIICKKIHSCS